MRKTDDIMTRTFEDCSLAPLLLLALLSSIFSVVGKTVTSSVKFRHVSGSQNVNK